MLPHDRRPRLYRVCGRIHNDGGQCGILSVSITMTKPIILLLALLLLVSACSQFGSEPQQNSESNPKDSWVSFPEELAAGYIEREVRQICADANTRSLTNALSIANQSTMEWMGSYWRASTLYKGQYASGPLSLVANVFPSGLVSGSLIQRISIEICP